jgi:hypothetical protein
LKILTRIVPDIIESWVEVDEIEDMPQNELCSYCYGSKLRLMQSSVYSAYDEDFAAMLKFVNNSKSFRGFSALGI